MLDVSFSELLLIVVVAVIFIGPKDLPVVIRAVAKAYAKFRAFLHEVHETFEEVARESGLHEAKHEFKRGTTWLEGEDGDLHEAYDISDLLPEFERGKRGENGAQAPTLPSSPRTRGSWASAPSEPASLDPRVRGDDEHKGRLDAEENEKP